MPLRSGGRDLGVLGIISGEAEAFDEMELPLLAELAGDVAFGLVTLRALAERDRAEAVLRESEARYRSLVELSPSAIYIQVDGKIVYINAAGMELLGASRPEDVVGRDYLDLVHPEERESAGERLARVARDQVPIPLVERRLRRLDNGQAVALVAASPTVYRGRPAIHLVGVDITQQRRTEEALHQTEALVRRVVEQSSDGIFVTDARGRVHRVEPGAGRNHRTAHRCG